MFFSYIFVFGVVGVRTSRAALAALGEAGNQQWLVHESIQVASEKIAVLQRTILLAGWPDL